MQCKYNVIQRRVRVTIVAVEEQKILPCVATLLYQLNRYLLTPRCRVLLENQTGLQLVKKFPAFHGTRRFITALTSVSPPVSILGQPNPVHIPTSHLLEIYPNIIHPSTSKSPQWSLSLRFPRQDPIHPSLLNVFNKYQTNRTS